MNILIYTWIFYSSSNCITFYLWNLMSYLERAKVTTWVILYTHEVSSRLISPSLILDIKADRERYKGNRRSTLLNRVKGLPRQRNSRNSFYCCFPAEWLLKTITKLITPRWIRSAWCSELLPRDQSVRPQVYISIRKLVFPASGYSMKEIKWRNYGHFSRTSGDL